jgi:hypothetical protein
MKAVKSRVRSLVLLALLGWAAAAFASGPLAYEARFWTSWSPGPSVADLVAGNLGILDLGQDAELLIVAYRHLTDLGVGPASQGRLRAALEAPAPVPWEATGMVQWLEARRRVPGAPEIGWFMTERAIERVEATYTYTEYRANCQTDAFVTAARTLEDRVNRFGAESPAVREWLNGQDRVFELCQRGDEPPSELDATWPEWLRQDREYQIAAAHFYAFHHEEALRRFTAIGRDAGSPWRPLARYLVARTALRAGNPARAQQAITEILADPAMAELYPAARRYETLLAIRDRPAERRRALGARLLAPSLADADPDELRQALIDFVWLVTGRAPGAGAPTEDLETWLIAMSGGSGTDELGEVPAEPNPTHPSVGTFRAKRTLPWLVAALATARGHEPEVPELLAAAAAVPGDSPAAQTVGFHRARLLLARAMPEAEAEARELLDDLLRRPRLAPAVTNRLKALRAGLAPTLDEYLRFSLVTPVEMGFDDGGSQLWPANPEEPLPVVLTDEAIAHLNRSVPTREWVRLVAEADWLPADWRRRLGLAAWVGAMLANDSELAARVVPLLAELVPPALAAELEAWRVATPGTARDFGADLILLRWPGLSPRLADDVGRRTPLDEMDGLRDNGWCEQGGLFEASELAPVRFLSTEASQAAAAEAPWPDLKPTALAIGPRLLTYAEGHRDDPRVPEALHRLVRFTRVGCAWGDEVGVVSKRAFDLLHRRYPRSEWAAKTPYWFKG